MNLSSAESAESVMKVKVLITTAADNICILIHFISSPGLCPWRGYVVTQSLASASPLACFGVCRVHVRVSTMFKFSKGASRELRCLLTTLVLFLFFYLFFFIVFFKDSET